MTGYERVRCAVEHRRPDRLPIDFSATPEARAALKRHLGIEAGETTEDYHFTVERVACFGSCALGPVMVVNDEVHGRVTPEQVTTVLGALPRDT